KNLQDLPKTLEEIDLESEYTLTSGGERFQLDTKNQDREIAFESKRGLEILQES
ncbi:unnamed protein product, partial [Brachionus calyciflorus]